jgi:NADH-quinone oxidoreductase subunit A
MSGYFGSYLVVGLLALAGVLLIAVAYAANRLLRPARPGPAKQTPYECGVDPVDPVDREWAQSQVRYYVFAFLYVVFAVEAVFVFPWAVVFARPGFGVGALIEMGAFVLVLAAGLLYAWRKKVLTWV